MKFDTRDLVMKKLLDIQENVRDYEKFSDQVDDPDVSCVFKQFAEESGMQAKKLREIINKYDNEFK